MSEQQVGNEQRSAEATQSHEHGRDRNLVEENVQQQQATERDHNWAGQSSAQKGGTPSDQAASSGPIPRRPRPLAHRSSQQQLIRRSQFVALGTTRGDGSRPLAHEGGVVVDGSQAGVYGAPITAQIELAPGILQPAGRATAMPPKRPNYLPTRYRYQAAPLTTSLGATALSSASAKPNRYSWAQMQQWHAAQAQSAADSYEHKTGEQGANSTGGFHYHFSSPFSSRVLVVRNPIVNLGEHTKSRLIKINEALKHFSEKWFSHVLLLLFLASYACLGAYVFISFEAPTEQWEKQQIIDTRLRIVNESYEAAQAASSRESYVDAFRLRFEEYERLLNRVCQSGMTSSSLENQWTFWGALFYSMTVFTTIGYGHLTPITFAGRVATMIYAIFGIPILLMVLADLGKLLTRIIKYAFKKFRYLYNKLLGRKASVRTRKLISDHSNQYIGVAKNAFERGFATYIQPYQTRILNASRVSSLSKRYQQHRQQHMGGVQLDESGNTMGLLLVDQDGIPYETSAASPQSPARMESSGVIVTPVKQTKPVSPQADSSKSKLASKSHPLAGAAGEQAAGSSESARAASGSQAAKRKISAISKATKRKSSVSRSSSTSNMATNAERQLKQSTSPGAAGRSSLDNQALGGGDKLAGSVASESNISNDLKRTNSMHEFDGQNQGLAVESQSSHHEDEDYNEMDEDLDIPVSFALFLLITYMMFGAVVFSIWESWNFFDALYFVFISMSTIGFGDLVPQHPKRMIGTFAYLLFGLALTSMCINVVQEKIHATFLRAKMQIGEKMGFDLDQIMADDYYEAGSAYGDELGAELERGDEDACSYANSVAASQTNSQHDSGPAQVTTSATDHNSKAAPTLLNSAVSGLLPDTPMPVPTPLATPTLAGASKSKSKEAQKWAKKRTASGATGSSEQQEATRDRHSTASVKRKASTSSKKMARQMSPTPASAAQSAPPPPAPSSVPLKAHSEVIRMFNLPVQSQVDYTLRAPPPHINQPVGESVRAFCEPIQQRPAATIPARGQLGVSPSASQSRPKLVSSHSQPMSLAAARSLGSSPGSAGDGQTPAGHQNGSQQLAMRSSFTIARPPDKGRQLHHSERSRPHSRSLSSSRHASVSHELSQLDDLIVALSRSPPERFGPLLGIPATNASRSSRSISPMLAAAINNNKRHPTKTNQLPVPNSSSNRRATSLMVRPRTSGADLPDKRSLVASNSPLRPGDERPPESHQRRKSSSSSTATTSRLNKDNNFDLNLGESQTAIDELEAVKFSAV